MKLAINADTRKVLSWGGEVIAGLAMTRRDVFPVEVKFIQGAGYVDLPDGSTGQLALKELGAWNGAIQASANWVKSGSGRAAVYTFMLSMDTPELNGLFAAEPDSVNMAMEITWSYSIGSLQVRETAVAVPVVVSNDYIR